MRKARGEPGWGMGSCHERGREREREREREGGAY
jgi:hypothetical protein